MENLNTYTLEELSIGKGRYGIPAPAIPFNSSKYTYLRITDINDDGSLNKENLMSVDAKNIDNFVLRKNDIVFARTGNSTGRSYFYDGSDGKLVYAGFLVKFSIDEKKVNPRILKYYTHSKRYFDWIHSFDTGGTRGNINAKTYGKMPITLPPRWNQNKIVNILKSLDDKIELNNKINRNLEAQAQAIFKSWFIDFEPFKNGKFIDSELGKIPEGWSIDRLGSVCECVLGGTPSRSHKEYWGGNIPWINSGKTNEFRVISPSEFISDEALKKSATKFLPKKTTILAITGATLGKVSLLEIGACANQSVVGILENDDLPYEYIYRYISHNIEKIISHQTGGAQQHINKDNIKNFHIILPPKFELKRYKMLVEHLYNEITTLVFQSRFLSQLRDTLLPKLMSGEIDISDIAV